MAQSREFEQSEGGGEKISRWLRNINALGAVALGGLAILAPPVAAAPLAAWAGLNAVQAGGFEALRRKAKQSRKIK